MPSLRTLAAGLAALALASPPGPAKAQGRAQTREVIVALAAEPWSHLPNTIVDWTTNNQLEHMYDQLADRSMPRPSSPPRLASGWKIVNDTTLEVHPAPGRQASQRRALPRPSVKATMDYIRTREQDALPAALGPGQGGPGRQRHHRRLHHRQAVARSHRPHRALNFLHAAQGPQGAGGAGPRRQADRHRHP